MWRNTWVVLSRLHHHHLRSHFGSKRHRCPGVAFLGPFDLSGHSRHTRVSVLFSRDPSMPSLMRLLNSIHVVGAVSDVHGVCGLLPSAGLVSSILSSSLCWSSASCALFGKSKGPNPLCCVKTAPYGFDGVCMLDTPPSALITCETDFLSYDTFDCACIS